MPPCDTALVQRGARIRRTPYYDTTQRHSPLGFTVCNHMYFPIYGLPRGHLRHHPSPRDR